MVSCGKREYPFILSEDTTIYEYPSNNIVGLKSIVIDKNDERKMYVYEFSKTTTFSNVDDIETIVESTKGEQATIAGLVAFYNNERLILDDVNIKYDDQSIYILMYIDSKYDGIHDIYMYNEDFGLQVVGIESPEVNVLYRNKGGNGDLERNQKYEKESKKWGNMEEYTYEYDDGEVYPE